MSMTTEIDRDGAHPVGRLLHPTSIAIIGASDKPGASGRNLLTHLIANEYSGDIHLVGRSGGEIDGRPLLTSVDELPEGVDLALIAVPAAGVKDTVEACARRGVRTGIVYASGFAEFGDEGRREQAEITRIARDGGVRLAGPNCIGYINHVNGIRTTFLPGGDPTPVLPSGTTGAVAVLAQSGGLMGLMISGLETRRVPISYCISTGNEAGLNLADYLDYIADDPVTNGVVLYIEDIRDPQAFLRAVRKVRAHGKTIVLTHAGRSERGQKAAASHTGALAAHYGVMKALVARAGACVVESVEELMDVAEILTRNPNPPTAGIGLATTSGAFCALALDTLAPLNVEVPDLSSRTAETLEARLPSYMKAANPLDLGTIVAVDPDLYHDAIAAMLADDSIGSLILGIAYSTPANNKAMLDRVCRAAAGSSKPVAIGLFGDITPISPELQAQAAQAGVVISNSPERMIRAMAAVTNYGRSLAQAKNSTSGEGFAGSLEFGPEVQVEWAGKRVLSQLGVPVPDGGLATSVGEAVEIGARVGYPVAAKVQARDLQHKTESGGLILGIADEAELRTAYAELTERAESAGVKALDGILVEEMAPRGVELMIGAQRHPTWGPVVMVALGGVWVEALGDVRLIPTDLSESEIIGEIEKLRCAKLFGDFRGAQPIDLTAVARVVATVAHLMEARPDIEELDINPLLARHDGVLALDVLISCAKNRPVDTLVGVS
ncbi:acetate--CoA ligase family protein [Rhodococcus koreensis]